MTQSKVIASIAIAGLALAQGAQADSHAEALQFGPAELMACSFKEDKGWSDLKDLIKDFNDWADDNDKDYSFWTITPRYREDNEMDFVWLGSWSSGAMMGSGWDAWIEDDDDVGKAFNETADCVSSLTAVTPIHIADENWMKEKRGVLWFAQCSMEEGKSLADAVAGHHTTDAAMTKMGSPTNSWAFVPALGAGDLKFDYYHVASWADYASVGAGFDAYFNGGGWQVAAEAEGDVLDCRSPNLYDFRLQRMGSR